MTTQLRTVWIEQARRSLGYRGINLASGTASSFRGVTVIEWPRLTSAYLLRLPNAIRSRLYVRGGDDVTVTVDDLESDPNEDPRILVTATAALKVHAVKKWITRFTLESYF